MSKRSAHGHSCTVPVFSWKAAAEKWVGAFDAALAGREDVERRKMFGYPAVFVNGNMAGSLHQEGIILRLGEDDRERLARQGGRPFEVMGRVMREYMIAPDPMATDSEALREWLGRSIAYAASLPKKAKKAAAGMKQARKTAPRERK